MKTLEQIEPRIDVATVGGFANYHHVINNPGSYYLSDNLEVSKISGILIGADDVTLNLNGFAISSTSGGKEYGIYVSSDADSATIRNGSIRGFITGVYSSGGGSLITEVVASECAEYGIYAGISARIVDCRTHDNPGTGIYAGEGSSLSGCTAYNNGGAYGIYAHYSASLEGCTAYNNQGTGIYASYGSSLRGCSAYGSQGGYGINATEGASLVGCTARNNPFGGIYASFGSNLRSCNVSGNGGSYAIYARDGSNLHGCSAQYNTGTGSASYGIWAGNGSVVVGCSAHHNTNTNSPGTSNQGVGISAGAGSRVVDCSAAYNRGDGIQIEHDTMVSGCICDNNGYNGDGAGIHATSQNNCIEDNMATDNDRGIDVDFGGNIIVRNKARVNTLNWEVAAGNICLVVSGTPCGAISGDSGGTAPGSTDPNANFTY